MLKLEKASRNQISIIVSDKQHFFSRSLAIAFAIAILYHLLFVVIFQIAPIKFRLSQNILPPIQVDTNSIIIGAVLANTDQLNALHSGLPNRMQSFPTLPSQPTFTDQRPVEYIKKSDDRINYFQRIEKNIYEPSFTSVNQNPKPPLQIKISGPLSEKSVLSDGLKNKMSIASRSNPKDTLSRTYNVLVENRTGRIFWYEPKERSQASQLDSLAENVLRDMKFAPEKGSFITAGEIELQYNFGKQ